VVLAVSPGSKRLQTTRKGRAFDRRAGQPIVLENGFAPGPASTRRVAGHLRPVENDDINKALSR
jgi:hypothetical protein